MDTLLTDRTRLRRLPERGSHEREVINAILDAGFVCHVGFVAGGQPYVIPTGYVRVDDRIYVHGSAGSRMVRSVTGDVDICLTVTLVDGVVLARSAFHHSINYRAVVILGRARLVTNADEKMHALRRFTNHVMANRFEEVRPPTGQELKATAVFAVPIAEASAKIRTGPPRDDAEDMALGVWAGVVPLRQEAGEPIPDGGMSPERQLDATRLIVCRAREGD